MAEEMPTFKLVLVGDGGTGICLKLLIHQFTIGICYSQSISMNLLFSEFPQVTPVFQEKQPL